MAHAKIGTIDIRVPAGVLRVSAAASRAFRVRLSPTGEFPEPGLVRYRILECPPPVAAEVVQARDRITLQTGEASLQVSTIDGRCTLCDGAGKPLLSEAEPPACGPAKGFRAEFHLPPGVRLYGLGDVSREKLEKRGEIHNIWVRNVASYVPIPILFSTGKWAILAVTSFRHYFDLGKSRPDRLAFGGRRGELDYVLFAGDGLEDLLSRYTALAGRPALLPLWGYGLTFVCNQQANAREMLDDCLSFRREGIPCDLVGLEPGWMETRYDYTVDKQWDPQRFYIPYWATKGPHTFLGAAERLGFKMSLWLCCDYDLSHEEEFQAAEEARKAGAAKGGGEASARHPDDFEKDEHFGHDPVLMDTITKPTEPWFRHLVPFVDQGVSAFKLDGARQVNEHPDRRWANGMDDEEMHNLYPAILNKQMSLGFRGHTGRRSMIYSSGGYVGVQKYSATWAGDTGGGPKPLVSILNHGLSGHVNASCDMDVFTPEGIHFGFLMPWSQVCSWAYWRHPWLLGEALQPMFTAYARLRYRLLPYIYSAAHRAARTGLPIARAMPLAFPEDPQSDALIRQYLFGDFLLTGAFIETFHLPEGQWIDWWSGEERTGPATFPWKNPEGKGGPLFVRAGALIPQWPPMQYVGQKSVDRLILEVFPFAPSSFTMAEDDGISLKYLEGQYAQTEMSCRTSSGRTTVTIGARRGDYAGMPETRTWDIAVHGRSGPRACAVDGKGVPWDWNAAARVVRLSATEDPRRVRETTVTMEWS
jgi:alpha-glucosidase